MAQRELPIAQRHLRRDHAPRRVVGAAGGRRSSSCPAFWATPPGRPGRAPLQLRATTSRRSIPPNCSANSPHAWFGPPPAWWPCVAGVLSGPAHPAVSRPLPGHLLLLSRRLLQGVLGRPARLRGRRAAQDAIGARPRSRSSCRTSTAIFLYVALFFVVAGLRRLQGALVHRPRHRTDLFGIGVGTLVLAVNVIAARRLHPRLPFAAPRGRRVPRPAGRLPGATAGLRLLELPQPRRTCAGPG